MVFFYIDREGFADDIQFVARSGSAAFDFESMGAVECAGQGRFGPLPEDLPYDRFPVRFRFRPANAPDAVWGPDATFGRDATWGAAAGARVGVAPQFESHQGVQESS